MRCVLGGAEATVLRSGIGLALLYHTVGRGLWPDSSMYEVQQTKPDTLIVTTNKSLWQ